MGITAKVHTTALPVVKVQVSPSGSLQSSGGITLKQQEAGLTRLDQLKDVVEPVDATDGSVLVYQADTDKYVVQQINFDGGTF